MPEYRVGGVVNASEIPSGSRVVRADPAMGELANEVRRSTTNDTFLKIECPTKRDGDRVSAALKSRGITAMCRGTTVFASRRPYFKVPRAKKEVTQTAP